MQLVALENFRLTDRNKAGGDAILEYQEKRIKADLIFYLQGYQCLNIRLGRHDKEVTTGEMEKFLEENKTKLRKMVQPDIERLKKERMARYYGQD